MALLEVNITPFPLPLSIAKRHISRLCLLEYHTQRHPSLGQHRIVSSSQHWIRQTSRSLNVALTRLRVEHTTVKTHLHHLHLASDPFCPWCIIIEETSGHFILQCPHFILYLALLRCQITALNIITFDIPSFLTVVRLSSLQKWKVFCLSNLTPLGDNRKIMA